MRVEIEFYQREKLIKIESDVRKNPANQKVECEEIYQVYWDGLIFNLAEDDSYLPGIEELIIEGDIFQAVNEMIDDMDYTELIDPVSWEQEHSYRGVSPRDFV